MKTIIKIITGTLFLLIANGSIFAQDLMDQCFPRANKLDLINVVKNHNPRLKTAANKILARVYEANQRSVGNSKYGQIFPMNPEIMHHLMTTCKGKTVLNIADASGENGILLALAGAKHVYVNDIDPTEINTFRMLKAKLPKAIKANLTSVPGDCFKLAKKIERHSIDIIYVRNFFHFVKQSDYSKFFELIKTLLKPGGTLVITMNNKGPLAFKHPEFFERYPLPTCYEIETLLLDNVKPSPHLLQQLPSRPCTSEEADALAYENNDVINSRPPWFYSSYNNDGIYYMDKFQILSKKAKATIAEFIKTQGSGYRYWPSDFKIRLLSGTYMLFSTETASSILKKYGFKIDSAGYLDSYGHFFKPGDDLEGELLNESSGPLVSIIATLPEGDETEFCIDDSLLPFGS